jgi:hypothetical protein
MEIAIGEKCARHVSRRIVMSIPNNLFVLHVDLFYILNDDIKPLGN